MIASHLDVVEVDVKSDGQDPGQSTLGDLIRRPAVRVGRTCPLATVVEEMDAAEVSSVLVDGDGIVTERDIARALARGVEPSAAVEDIATWDPVVAPASMTVVEAAALMLNEHVRHLIVEQPGGSAVVSMRDVTAVLLEAANPHVWVTSLRIAVQSPPEIWLG